MARFKFQLDGVLRQRIQAEREAQRMLAEQQAILNTLTGELRQLDQQLQAANDDLRRNRLTGAIDLAFLAAHRRYSIGMQRRAIDQARRIAAAQQRVEEARGRLIEAARQRKVIQKLRERRYQLWQAEQSRTENLQLDEVGMQMSRMASQE